MLRTSQATAPAFADPVPLPGGAVSEPGIDVSPAGVVFVNGIKGLPVHGKLWRSTDAGRTFAEVTFDAPYDRFPGGGDSDVVTGPDGRVYFLDLSAASSSVARSEDDGASWIAGTPFTTLPVSDRQWIALGRRDPATGLDTVYVVYHLIQPPQSIMFARSTDGGLTWTHHAAPAGLTGALPGQLVADRDFVAFPYESEGTLYLMRSLDAGTTWSRHRVNADQRASSTITALALDGTDLYITWVDRVDYGVRVARSTDRGRTWDATAGAISSGGTAVFPWVAARDGTVAVTWYGAAGAPRNPNAVGPDAAWRLMYAETSSWSAGFSTPVAASKGVVKRGPVCTAGLSCSTGRELGDFQQVALDGRGTALASYVDVVCDPFCGGATVARRL